MLHESAGNFLDELKCGTPTHNQRNSLVKHAMNSKYLFAVSSDPSKLFWRLSSSIRASFAFSSSEVGKFGDIGGVTPHCRTEGAAMLVYCKWKEDGGARAVEEETLGDDGAYLRSPRSASLMIASLL